MRLDEERASTRPPLFAGLLVVALLGTLGFGWLSGECEVRLVVGDEVIATRTHARTVAELLARSGVEVAPGAVVDPPPAAPVVDGMTVRVTLAAGLSEVGQGEAVETAARIEPSLPAEPRRSALRASRSTREPSGAAAATPARLRVPIAADGRTRTALTRAGTVSELLDELGILLGPHDRVVPGPDVRLEPGTSVTVQRVSVSTEVRTEALPHGAEERQTAALPAGERRTAAAGEDGQREITEEVVRVDGVEESRSVVSERVVRPPTPAVVEVGTAPPAQPAPAPAPAPVSAPPPPPSEAPAPAPAAEPSAQPEPEPEVPPANAAEGSASWYEHPEGGMTAAHRTLPRGTLVTVTNLANGRAVQVRINDRGPYVGGRIIDLNREAFAQIAPLGAGVARVRIEW